MLRYLAVAALLAVGAFGQQSDPPSGVLVPLPPKSFYNVVRQNLVKPAGAVPRQAEPPRVCAIPLVRVPVQDHMDDGILLKSGNGAVDSKMVVPPAIPACR